MNNDKRIIEVLKYLKEKGLKKTTCIGLTLVILMTTSASSINKFDSQKKMLPLLDKIYYDHEDKKMHEKTNPPIVSDEEKLDIILERENLTEEQFAEIVATVIGEAAPHSYEDAYAVINTFYNRKISEKWINEVLKVTGIDNGNNLYAQITLENQSSVYSSGLYKEFLGVTDVPAYQAVIDFLYSLESMHDYLCFYASFGNKENKEQFVDGGNLYYSPLASEDRTNESITLARTNYKEKHEINRY